MAPSWSDGEHTMYQALRVAIVIDAVRTHAWVSESVRRVAGNPCASVVAAIVSVGGERRTTGIREVRGDLHRGWRYRAFERAERIAYPATGDALRPDDAAACLPLSGERHEPQVVWRPVPRERTATDLEHRGLDVILWLCGSPPPRECYSVPKYGVWTLQFGEDRLPPGPLTGFWEVLNGRPTTASYLVAMGASGSRVVLYRGLSATDSYSTIRNRSAVLWKGAMLPGREIARLAAGGYPRLAERVRQTDAGVPEDDAARAVDSPAGRAYVSKIALYGFGRVKAKVLKTTGVTEWFIRTARFKNGNIYPSRIDRWSRLLPPHDRYWADPFVVYDGGIHYLFVEEYVYAEGKGHIAVLALEQGRLVSHVPALVADHHLSYPFVFSWQGSWYMIPESSQSRSVDLYQCISFPDRWVHVCSLLTDVSAVDSSLILHDGIWWLFTTTHDGPGTPRWDELSIYWSESLRGGDWHAHPKNPVVSDVRSARSGGPLFTADGDLYRPSQDCSLRYGSALRIQKVERLSRTEYREVGVDLLKPKKTDDLLGIHHLSFADDFIVTDAVRWRRKSGS